MKDMQELLDICKTKLDNANLDISMEMYTNMITLHFTVGVSLEEIVINCDQYERLRLIKSHDDDQGFFVGTTKVELINSKSKLREVLEEEGWQGYEDKQLRPMFWIRCSGSITLDIVCGVLEWHTNNGQLKILPIPELVE